MMDTPLVENISFWGVLIKYTLIFLVYLEYVYFTPDLDINEE